MTDRETVLMLLEVVWDFAREGDGVLGFLDHIGFDLRTISTVRQLPDALLGFYRIRAGVYDICRLEEDMDSWGPIARAVEDAVAHRNGL